jgi:hypothetical protein
MKHVMDPKLPGTHSWMLYKDIVRGELVIRRGCYLSITSVLPDGRVTCCVESVGPLDVLWNDSPQLKKLHRDDFRMPELYSKTPTVSLTQTLAQRHLQYRLHRR